MNRRGSALLLVLWLLALLAGVVAVGLGGKRSGALAARNRLALLRGAWAAEACLQIVMARAAVPSAAGSASPEQLSLDSVDLGQGIWCAATLTDPGERLNLNTAAEDQLRALFGDSVLVSRAVEGRPWPAVEALPPAFERFRPWLTVRGDGRINLNRAAAPVLASVPALGVDGAQALIARRERGPGAGGRSVGTLRSADEAIAALPPSIRARVGGAYDRFAAATSYSPAVLVAELSGHSGTGAPSFRELVTLVPAGTRLAIVRREPA